VTARGLDAYPYALSLMKWGDEWLPNEKGPPVRHGHKTCNKLLHPSAIRNATCSASTFKTFCRLQARVGDCVRK
jgi:hypothetical protein